MSTTFGLSEQRALAAVKAELNAAMQAAAEPIVRSALVEVEKAMRERLAAHLVALIEQRVRMYGTRDEFHIVIDRSERAAA